MRSDGENWKGEAYSFGQLCMEHKFCPPPSHSMTKFLGSSISSGLSHWERAASSALSQGCKALFNVNACPGPPNLVAPIFGVDKRMRRPEMSIVCLMRRASLSLISLHPHVVYCPGGGAEIKSGPSSPRQWDNKKHFWCSWTFTMGLCDSLYYWCLGTYLHNKCLGKYQLFFEHPEELVLEPGF